MKPQTFCAALAVGWLAVACEKTPPARYGSSAAEPAYAERYPGALAGARQSYLDDETLARSRSAELSQVPGELKTPDWNAVGAVIDLADGAGKSADYVQGVAEATHVARFYSEEKQQLQQKVGGSVAYTAKEKNCDVDFYGSVSGALDRAMEKTLEERLRSHNPAHRYIEDHADALGEPNLPKLEKRADEIALASYLVHVRLPSAKQDLDALLAEASDVRKTLERQQTEAEAVLADAKASPRAKKVAKERMETAAQARAGLDGAISGAEQASKELEQRSEAVRAEYQKALDALRAAVKSEAEKQPKAP